MGLGHHCRRGSGRGHQERLIHRALRRRHLGGISGAVPTILNHNQGSYRMGRIVSAYFKGFGQLSDPKTRAVIWASVGWSVAVFIALFMVLTGILKSTTFISIGFLETLFDTLGQFAAFGLAYFLFPPVVTAIGSLLLDRVVEAVERRHYPALSIAPELSLAESIRPALKLLAVTVGYNLLCLPLLFFPPLFLVVYWSLNGYLLSREYFELVALRRVSKCDVVAMRARWKTPLFIAGVGFAFLLTVPVVNIITPVIATATMVHLFEAWRKRDNVPDKATHATPITNV